MRVSVVALALVLAGCSLFRPEPKPEDARPVAIEEWGESDATDAQALSDADSCRQQADAILRQDQAISADIASRDDQGAFRNQAPELSAGMNEYEARRRHRRIFEECMRARGYTSSEE